MGLKSSILRLGTNLMVLAVFSGAASSSENKHPESAGPAVSSACDFTDCVQDPQPCQTLCSFRFNPAAVQSGSLAPRPNDHSIMGIALTRPKNSDGAPPPSPKSATSGSWWAHYMTAAADAPEPSSQTALPKSGETPQPHWSHLPIWGPEAEARGYRVPLPFGVGTTFYDAKQPVTVRDLKLGIGRGPTESAQFVKVGQPIISWQQNVSSRFDIWPFPFVNLYGVAGYTRGNTRGRVTVTGPVLGLLNQELPLLAEFHGPTFGGGMTLAGGVKLTEWRDLHAFMVGDVNHTVTVLSFKGETLISHTRPQVTVAAVRTGLRGAVTESIQAGMWLGAMYQLIQEEVAGSVVGRDIEFIINQRASSPWNTLIGGQIEFGKHFNVLVEGGVGPRSSILTGAVFRF